MRVHLGRQLKVPEEIAVTSVRPKCPALVSSIKASSPNRAERSLGGGHERKLGKYSSPIFESERRLENPTCCLIERGYLDNDSGVHVTQKCAPGPAAMSCTNYEETQLAAVKKEMDLIHRFPFFVMSDDSCNVNRSFCTRSALFFRS